MAPDSDLKKRVGRKLTKKRAEGHEATMSIPDRFRDGDDADEDITAMPGGNPYMNQSVFGMIAAAGSQVDFHARFDAQSSDEEDGDGDQPGPARVPEGALKVEKRRKDKSSKDEGKHHRRKFSESKLIRSFARLGSSKSKSSSTKHEEVPASPSSSDVPAPSIQLSKTSTRESPVMSRMLEARRELSTRESSDISRSSKDILREEHSSSLAQQLMEIFNFDQAEDVVEEYPCWLLKSVLLQGYMYITTKHICFYAYLPKRSNEVVKSGYLSKSGRRNPKYNRYWFRLKGDVLSYYSDPSDLYFPAGNIDLRYGISATVSEREKGKDATHFTVVTHQRNFNFKADSAPSAKEWVKALQKIIFRSHNDGDSVKISLPIENIIDIEDSQIIDFADTCKIRVIDNDETYAIDEYFFSFFSFGKEALNVLRILAEDTAAKNAQVPEDLLAPPVVSPATSSPGLLAKRNSSQTRRSPSPSGLPPINTSGLVLKEDVKATLSPLLTTPGGGISARPSAEISRASSDVRRSMDLTKLGRRSVDLSRMNVEGGRRSMSASRRSLSRNRLGERRVSEKHDSSDSYVHSLEDPGSSAALVSASEDTQGSASQILRGSDVFLSPTIQRSSSATRARKNDIGLSLDGTPTMVRRDSKQASVPPTPKPMLQPESQPASSTGKPDTAVGSTSLQGLMKAGAYPLHRAAGLAGFVNKHSKRMSTLLATESMGYVEKVSGMWKGGKKHYDESSGLAAEDGPFDDDDEAVGSGDRFREHFALPATEKLQAAYFGSLIRVLPLYGKIYISDRSFCFRSLLPGTRTKLILPLKDIENVDKEKGFRFGYSGLVVVIKGHEELFFEFNTAEIRDDCAVTLIQNLETVKYLKESGLLSMEEQRSAEDASAEHKALQQARMENDGDEHDLTMPKSTKDIKGDQPPIMFDDPRASILNFKPTEPLRITCLTIGSRGDVQPYIALCKGLLAEGHKPRIATHHEFKDWVEGHGIEFRPVEGDPAELMRICVENGMFTYSFLREASSKFRGWIDELLSSGWQACQDSDILIESPSAMGGIHIAEALQIPYFRAFSMPWTRTRAYPHAFAVPEHKMGGAYNYITYVMFDNVFWKAIAGQVNRWRKKELGLQATSLEKMQPNKVPFLYNISPSVVVPPLDYSDWIRVTGYWFLDEGANGWTPPKDLTDFIQKARDDGKRIVYVGFGSIVVADSAALTNMIIESVLKADVRCILSKGWSDRLDTKTTTTIEAPLPEEILQIKSAPHDWLFKQIDAAAHHGGAGTTGASLRAGLPTVIKPFFGDQFFFGNRVEDLGVGIHLRRMNTSVFARALWEAAHSERMIIKAKVLGEQIRSEDGVATAIQSLYRDLEYAKSLIKKPNNKTADEPHEESEESWTFIGDDNDPELIKRIQQWEGITGAGAAKSDQEDMMTTSMIDTGSGRNKTMKSTIMTTGVTSS